MDTDDKGPSDDEARNSGDEWDAAAVEDNKIERTESKTKVKKKKKKERREKKTKQKVTNKETDENVGNMVQSDKSNIKYKKSRKGQKVDKQPELIDEEDSFESEHEHDGIIDEGSDNEQNGYKQQQPVENVHDNGNEETAVSVQVDPKQFLRTETSAVEISLHADDSDVEDSEQLMNIREAFANDDVVEEFEAEKEDIKKKGRPKDIDLTLPGWGDWGGAGIKVSEKKRKKFTIKAPEEKKRKDDRMQNVIINEESNKRFAKHQVSYEVFVSYTEIDVSFLILRFNFLPL